MNKINLQIIILIIIVSIILIANTIFNKYAFTESERSIQKRDTINLVLVKLRELSFQTVFINDEKNEYLNAASDTLYDRIVSLKNQEFELIKEITTLLIKNNLIDQYNKDLVILNKLELDFNESITKDSTLKTWIAENKHKTLILNSAIKNLESILYDKKNNYINLNKYSLQKIYVSDIIQSIVIIFITLLISLILYKEKNKYRKLASEYKQLNIEKDRFFSIIGHDLRNPFSAILGLSELVIENIDKYPTAKTLKFVENIHKTSKLTYELLENLLNWARIQTGKLKPKFQKTSPNSLLSDVIELHKHNANQKYITIQTEFISQSEIFVDVEMIRTIVRNILANAIKFTNLNGIITVKTTETNKYVNIIIEDNGVGMDNKTIESLFKLDAKTSTTGTSGETGTGLGLILCKELVELNNGHIVVESEIEKATKFTIMLPINNAVN